MKRTGLLAFALAVALAVAVVPEAALAARGSGAFGRTAGRAAGEAAGDAAEQALIVTGAVVAGLTLIGLMIWYFIRSRHDDEKSAAARAGDAVRTTAAMM